jgi:hypothetical protein
MVAFYGRGANGGKTMKNSGNQTPNKSWKKTEVQNLLR